jgi:nitroreductase
MEINADIVGPRAVLQDTQQRVVDAAVLTLIVAATHAPSAVDQQPWSFTVVRDRDILDRVSGEAKSHLIVTTPASAPQRTNGALDRLMNNRLTK